MPSTKSSWVMTRRWGKDSVRFKKQLSFRPKISSSKTKISLKRLNQSSNTQTNTWNNKSRWDQWSTNCVKNSRKEKNLNRSTMKMLILILGNPPQMVKILSLCSLRMRPRSKSRKDYRFMKIFLMIPCLRFKKSRLILEFRKTMPGSKSLLLHKIQRRRRHQD